MKQNRKFTYRLIACILLKSLFLQSCSNFSNPLIPREEAQGQQAKIRKDDSHMLMEQDLIDNQVQKKLIAKGGHAVTLYQGEKGIRATVDENLPEGFSRQLDLTVYLEDRMIPTEILQLDKQLQRQVVEVNFPKVGNPGDVRIYKQGLMGGGKKKKNRPPVEDKEGKKEIKQDIPEDSTLDLENAKENIGENNQSTPEALSFLMGVVGEEKNSDSKKETSTTGTLVSAEQPQIPTSSIPSSIDQKANSINFDSNVVIKGVVGSQYFTVINQKYKEKGQQFQFKAYGNRHILHTSFDEKKYLDEGYKAFDSKERGLEMVVDAFQKGASKIDPEQLRGHLGYMTNSLPEEARNLIAKKYQDVKIEQYKAVDHYREYLIAAISNNSFPKVELKWDTKKGWGVYALEMIPLGALVGVYAGEIMTKDFYRSRGYSSEYVADINEDLCVDAEVHGNFTRFMNHASKKPARSTSSFLIRIKKIPYRAFVSFHIDAGQEITWDYGPYIPFEEK